MIVYEADQATHPAGRVLGRRDRHGRQQGRHQGRGRLLERRAAGARGVDDADAPAGEELAAQGRRPRGRGVRQPVRRTRAGGVINGVSLADRLDGSNTYDDGTLENHKILHPDYMTNIQQNWWAADFAGLAGRKVPGVRGRQRRPGLRRLQHAVASPAGSPSPVGRGAVRRTRRHDLPAGHATTSTSRRARPGGRCGGRRSSASTRMPTPTGWTSPAAWPARDALAQHVAGQQALVGANGTGDGRTYSFDPPTANSQDRYNGREEYAASQLAAGWLALYVSRNAWDKAFNLPALDGATYLPLAPMTPGADRLVVGCRTAPARTTSGAARSASRPPAARPSLGPARGPGRRSAVASTTRPRSSWERGTWSTGCPAWSS